MYTVFLFLVVTIPLQLVGILMLPFILPFISKDSETLPSIFRWFDNAEIPLGIGSQDDGLAGPKYYRDPAIASYKKFLFSDYLALLLCRYIWLAFRNPINYFQYKVIGICIPKEGIEVVQLGNPRIGNKSGDVSGVSHLIIKISNKTYYDYYKVIKLWSGRCLRIRLGHKLDKPEECTPGQYKQFVCTLNLAVYEGL